MPRMSIATIDNPEFINITPYNPLISECEIKVLYLGGNRNNSYITKEVATEMANTLPGCPIVGYYKKEKEDFRDHGDKITFDDEGIHFECMTKPYGFVSPDAKVWFQKFEDTDDFGNKIVREYMMTTGYLWTGQFKEAKEVIKSGRPQSMELDEETLDGKWSQDLKTGIDFFIINDAIFSKLCILGNDIEPCFEGASISALDKNTAFTKVDDGFKNTLYSMMKELKFALEGGQKMTSKENNVEFSLDQEKKNEEISFAKKEEEKKDTKDTKEEVVDEEKPDEEERKDKEKKYSLLEEKYNELSNKYSLLEGEYKELLKFKEEVENEKKDSLINSFYMLSDEDKKDIIENKSKYTLDEIEAKLSVICVRKKVNFDLEEDTEEKEERKHNITTFNLEDEDSSVPAWIKAVRANKRSREE